MYPTSQDYVLYAGYLLVLNRLIAGGGCDSEQADFVRDLMEAPYYRMSHAEKDSAREMAAWVASAREAKEGGG